METRERIYISLVTLFSTVVIVSNFITPKLLLFGTNALPAGMITYPLTFLLNDLVTEIYGSSRSRLMIYLGFFMSIVASILVRFAIHLPPYEEGNQTAFATIFGQNMTIVFASMCAYVIAQLIDVKLYAWIWKRTGDRFLWLRSNGSTLVSQGFDSLIVMSLTFGWGFGYSFELVALLILYSYGYKALFSVALTPLYYLLVHVVKKQLHLIESAS